MKRLLIVLILLLAVSRLNAEQHRNSVPHRSTVASRNAKGRIQRSPQARRQFMRETGYPHGRPGWIIDHVIPLQCGGLDAPTNMQWQTRSAAREKDKTERACRK